MRLDVHTHQIVKSRRDLLRIVSCRAGCTIPNDPSVRLSAGLHPYFWEDIHENSWQWLEQIVQTDPRICAIGEAGLDKRSPIPLDRQKLFFERQIILSERTQLPLIIHCVQAWDELLRIKHIHMPKMPWIIHGYRRGKELARQLISSDLYLSFGQQHQPDSLRLAYDTGRLLLETDDASINIHEVYEKAATTLSIPLDTLEEWIDQTAQAIISPYVSPL